jgi:predicted transcriptional regulator
MKKEKNDNSLLKEYVKKLSVEDLNFLIVRLTQRLASDMSEAAELMQRDKDLDRWLCLSSNSQEWYDKIDKLQEFIKLELDRR